ncbi:MAG: cyclic nucleotide-binding domain-containing protein, partial [Deltaproteobacteria bacterium]|nr:cyclic nucleotide-binding domain-containing protein [Deltaproteobacteria bacterium]
MKKDLLQEDPKLLAKTIKEIGATPYFRSLDHMLLEKVFVSGSIYSLKKGETLIRQSDKSNRMFYILISGEFEVYADNQFILRLDEPGQTLGEMAIINPRPRTADVIASK